MLRFKKDRPDDSLPINQTDKTKHFSSTLKELNPFLTSYQQSGDVKCPHKTEEISVHQKLWDSITITLEVDSFKALGIYIITELIDNYLVDWERIAGSLFTL